MTSGTRRWRGSELDDRVRQRRAQLVDAGFELLGTQGAGAVSVRAVCRQAELTERYFYESFADRSALLVAVLTRVAEQARDVIANAVAAGGSEVAPWVARVVSSFTQFLDADPRRTRILFVESLATPELVARSTQLLEEFTALISAGVTAGGLAPGDRLDGELNARAIFGALARLYADRASGALVVQTPRLNSHVTAVVLALAAVTGRRVG